MMMREMKREQKINKKKKRARIHGTLVACGWTGAAMQVTGALGQEQ